MIPHKTIPYPRINHPDTSHPEYQNVQQNNYLPTTITNSCNYLPARSRSTTAHGRVHSPGTDIRMQGANYLFFSLYVHPQNSIRKSKLADITRTIMRKMLRFRFLKLCFHLALMLGLLCFTGFALVRQGAWLYERYSLSHSSVCACLQLYAGGGSVRQCTVAKFTRHQSSAFACTFNGIHESLEPFAPDNHGLRWL